MTDEVTKAPIRELAMELGKTVRILATTGNPIVGYIVWRRLRPCCANPPGEPVRSKR